MPETPTEKTSKSSSEDKDDFKGLSLAEMEKTLSTEKDEIEAAEDKKVKDSETQVKNSEADKAKEKSVQEKSDESIEDKTSKDKQEIDYKKSYDALLPEFTRRSQELKELKQELDEIRAKVQGNTEQGKEKKKISVLAQLKEKNPEAAELLEKIKEEIREEVMEETDKKVKPVEERVVLREREKHRDGFVKAAEDFKKGPYADLEPELMTIFNEEPNFWQRIAFERPDAFQLLERELFYRFRDKAAEIANKKNKSKNSSEEKKNRVEEGHVEGKTKVSVEAPSKMDLKNFKKLPLKEMEDLLPHEE